jgi:arabinose-5-phosphate isomerase
MNYLSRAKEIIQEESRGLATLMEHLDEKFNEAIEILKKRKGKIVVVGAGKSGLIGRKFSATLTSTGNPAVFLHPGDALHGDLGIVEKGDAGIFLSYSGESPELVEIVRAFQRIGVPIIAITGNPESFLGKKADLTLRVFVEREACPHNLAPTTSTTAILALCDAIAIVLMEAVGTTPEQFALYHPGGFLGRRLRTVKDLMHTGDEIPLVNLKTPMGEVLLEMTRKRLGITGVCNGKKLVGVITDGDLRRALKKFPDLLSRKAEEIMTKNPKWVSPETLAEKALAVMEEHKITCLFVLQNEQIVGVIHMHDLISHGYR